MYGEGVVAIYSTLIVPSNNKKFELNDEKSIFYSIIVTLSNVSAHKGAFLNQTVPRTPEIFTSLLHICDLRSRTTIEKLYI